MSVAFNSIDGNRLVEQFQDHRRLAQRDKDKQPQEPASSAWQKAVCHTRGRRGWPVDSLLPILQRFLVAPGSTAGIEHAFSAAKRALGEQWQGSPRAEERRVLLLLKAQAMPDIENSILQSARLVWGQCCGPARRRSKPSLGFHTSAWLRRKASVSVAECDRPTTEATWLKKRRTGVCQLGSESDHGPAPSVPCSKSMDRATRGGGSAAEASAAPACMCLCAGGHCRPRIGRRDPGRSAPLCAGGAAAPARAGTPMATPTCATGHARDDEFVGARRSS